MQWWPDRSTCEVLNWCLNTQSIGGTTRAKVTARNGTELTSFFMMIDRTASVCPTTGDRKFVVSDEYHQLF